MLTDPFRFNGGNEYVKGALKDISLNKIIKRDIEIWHTRMECMLRSVEVHVNKKFHVL